MVTGGHTPSLCLTLSFGCDASYFYARCLLEVCYQIPCAAMVLANISRELPRWTSHSHYGPALLRLRNCSHRWPQTVSQAPCPHDALDYLNGSVFSEGEDVMKFALQNSANNAMQEFLLCWMFLLLGVARPTLSHLPHRVSVLIFETFLGSVDSSRWLYEVPCVLEKDVWVYEVYVHHCHSCWSYAVTHTTQTCFSLVMLIHFHTECFCTMMSTCYASEMKRRVTCCARFHCCPVKYVYQHYMTQYAYLFPFLSVQFNYEISALEWSKH